MNTPYRDPAMAACPVCRGITGFIEMHMPFGELGPAWPIPHACGFCASTGVVQRCIVRSYWLCRPASA